MSLHTPKEPQHVKEWIKSLEEISPKTPGVRWDSLNVWYGNQLPKYLWDEWKNELKPRGFTWQKFLKLLCNRTDSILMWYKGLHPWEQFIRDTVVLIEGPLGDEIARK